MNMRNRLRIAQENATKAKEVFDSSMDTNSKKNEIEMLTSISIANSLSIIAEDVVLNIEHEEWVNEITEP